MNRSFFKMGLLLFVSLSAIQTITYYSVSETRLLHAVGENYESYVLENNSFEGVTVVTDLKVNTSAILENFELFNNYEVQLSNDFENPFATIGEQRYEYLIKYESRHPFGINYILETEHAPQYGARWNSCYIWVLFDWVLIKKENKGIS